MTNFTQKDFRKFHRDSSAELAELRAWWATAKVGAPARVISDIELQLQILEEDVARYARLAGVA